MGRQARDKRDLPHPRPVERITLNESHTGGRLAASIALLLVGAALLAYSFLQFLTPETGWTAIQASTSGGPTCGEEFVFLYRLGAGGESAAAENRAVTSLYTDACRRAFQLFHSGQEFEGAVNLCTINRHPNETLTVDAALYTAFETLEASGSRALYLGPVYARYSGVFSCIDDSQLADFDPRASEEVRREYAACAAYASDPQAVWLRLLGEGQIRLEVSEAYAQFARQEGIECFIDFSWMRNAFIADYLAQVMLDHQYTAGAISSYDGFMRNLDGSGTKYAFQIDDWRDGAVSPAAVMDYEGPQSLVCLRDYPVNSLDSQRFYTLRTGEIRTPYLDPQDGMSRSAVHTLLCCGPDRTCGEILAEMLPIYIADTLEEAPLLRLQEKGISAVFCREDAVCYTDPALRLRDAQYPTVQLGQEPR